MAGPHGFIKEVAISHVLLDGTIITDSQATTAVRGMLPYVNSLTKWAGLSIGTANQVVTTADGIDVSWGQVAWASITGKPSTFSSTPHSLLDGLVDNDTTVTTVLRGMTITGQGASPTWKGLAVGTANQVYITDGTDVMWGNVAWSIITNVPTTIVEAVVNDTNVTANILKNTISLGWQGTLSEARGGTNSSSFTQGSIPFGTTNALIQDNSNLFWDEANKRLGIKTAIPATTVEVVGTIKASQGTNIGLAQVAVADSVIEIQADGFPEFSTVSHTATAGTAGEFAGYRSRGTGSVPTVVSNGDWLFSIGASGYDGSVYQFSQGIAFIVDDPSVGSGKMGGALAFFTTLAGGTPDYERMRITNAGRVGIGTANPGQLLDVAGQINATNILDSALTAGRLVYAGTSGLLTGLTTGTSSNALISDGTNPKWSSISFSVEANFQAPTSTANAMLWRASFPCTITAIKAYMYAGTTTGTSANALKSGAKVRSVDLQINSNAAWVDGGAVQNTSVAIGDTIELALTSVLGTPSQVAIQLDLTRP